MFSNIKPKKYEININNVNRDIAKIMKFINKYEEDIKKILEDKGSLFIKDILNKTGGEDYELLVFPLFFDNNDDYWKLISKELQKKLGIYVSAKVEFEYDLDKLGRNGLLSLYLTNKL